MVMFGSDNSVCYNESVYYYIEKEVDCMYVTYNHLLTCLVVVCRSVSDSVVGRQGLIPTVC